MIKRAIHDRVLESLSSGKVTILYGARQTGKTTLALELAKNFSNPLFLSCDEQRNIDRLKPNSADELRLIAAGHDALFLDEAQLVSDIGRVLKIFHDQIPGVKVMATGSSSFDLANKVKEPLTGRSNEFVLYPLSVTEQTNGRIEAENTLEQLILYGGYPATKAMGEDGKAGYLRDLSDKYLHKDVFIQDTVYDLALLKQLVKLLAYQVGSETSYAKIANDLGSNKNTITRYVDLLEKSFIVFRLYQYRRNQSREVGKLRKVYFYDTGVRNGVIDDFNPLSVRPDSGGLWENYCHIERKKKLQRDNLYARIYYWRSDRGQEIDLIEESSAKLAAYEFKMGTKSRVTLHPQFIASHGEVPFSVIDRSNFYSLIG